MNTLPRFLFANRHGGILYNGLPCPRLAMILNKDDEEKELLIVKWAEARREAGMWRHYFVVSYEKGGKVVTSTSIGLYNADPPVDLGHGYVLTTEQDLGLFGKQCGWIWRVKRLTSLQEVTKELPIHRDEDLPSIAT